MKQRNRLLLTGFVVSVALHVAIVPVTRFDHPTVVADEIPPLHVERLLPTPRPKPTPVPTPRPRATQPPAHRTIAARPRLSIHVARIANHGTGVPIPPNPYGRGGDVNGAPDGTAPPGPASDAIATPAATSAPATPAPTPTVLTCARPNVPAATIRAAQPEMPAIAQQQGISGEVAVVVSLDAASRVVAVRVQRSASAVLNAAALAAARASSFQTEVRDCAPVAADYLFTVEFASD